MQINYILVNLGTNVVALPEKAQFVGATFDPLAGTYRVHWVASDQESVTAHYAQRRVLLAVAFEGFIHDGPVLPIGVIQGLFGGQPAIFALELLP